MARVRLFDVAREAGVSVGGASDALSGKGRIPDATRARVRATAARLGYVANPFARGLRVGRAPLVGLVVSSLRRGPEFRACLDYWTAIVGRTAIEAADRGYAVVLLPELGTSTLGTIPLSGIAIVDVGTDDPSIERALATGLPVLVDGGPDDPRVAVRVETGYERTVAVAMDHLHERGARRPAIIHADAATPLAEAIGSAYGAWCLAAGTEPVEVRLEPGPAGMAEAIERALDAGADGIYDMLSIDGGGDAIAARRGRSVGRDLLLVVLDDDERGVHAAADRSTISVGILDLLGAATTAMIDRIEGRTSERAIVAARIGLHPRASSAGPTGSRAGGS